VKKISRNLDFLSSEEVHTTVMNQLSLVLNGLIAGGEEILKLIQYVRRQLRWAAIKTPRFWSDETKTYPYFIWEKFKNKLRILLAILFLPPIFDSPSVTFFFSSSLRKTQKKRTYW
jgi:hypothetical protein